MRLINFGLGEIIDRLTILALKVSYGESALHPVDHFRREQASLYARAAGSTRLSGRVFEAALELSAVNARIWQEEDYLRGRRRQYEDCPEDVDLLATVAIAFRIQALNDRRHALLHTINTEVGDAGGLEKSGAAVEVGRG